MDDILTPSTIFLSLLGGTLPAVFWLWFWLKEDKLHPEPRSLIILSFLIGMIATIIAYPLEKFIVENVRVSDFFLIFLWATAEEVLKFAAISLAVLRSKYFDEPIDAVIYFITIALGFSAMENAMFLINPIGSGDMLTTIMLGNFRFIGATLLHVAASGLVGIALALTFFDRTMKRKVAIAIGLLSAILLHTLFNFTIIRSEGGYLYEIFIGIWIFVLGILLVCEKIKRMPQQTHIEVS